MVDWWRTWLNTAQISSTRLGLEKRVERGQNQGLYDRLDPTLLDPAQDFISVNPSFNAALDVDGKYETMRFVLSLSPRNHELMENIENGVYDCRQLSPEVLQAYSTYLHETVHWWQHVGSTSGLMLSLSYFGQSHSSMGHLKDAVKKFGAIKPLKRWADETLRKKGTSAQAELRDANIAINNALDIEYYKLYAMMPKEQARILFEQQHFECVGHCYHMAVGQLLGMISGAIGLVTLPFRCGISLLGCPCFESQWADAAEV